MAATEPKLTPKQEGFCLAYIETGNASEAYRRAYDADKMAPTTINRNAKTLLDNSKIAARLAALRKPAADKAQLTLESHLEDLKMLRNMAVKDKKWAAAIHAEIARGKAAGLSIERHEITGKNGGPVESATFTKAEYEDIARKVASEI